MGKYKSFWLILALVNCLTLSCSTEPKQRSLRVPPEGIFLRLRPLQGRMEMSSHYSHIHTKSYNKGVVTETEDDIVSFDVATETVLVDMGQLKLHMNMTTIRKEGNVELHDLAFPELGESLRFVFYPNAEVASVDGYPKTSVFYIPPISLPIRKVRIGDTWKMSKTWLSAKGQIPFRVDIVTIFKGLHPCGVKDKCADLEISGQVSLLNASKSVNFKSEIQGRMLFSIGRGTMVWSLVRNHESLDIQEDRTVLHSCLTSQLIAPEKNLWPVPKDIHCDPHVSGAVPLTGI